MPVMTDEERAYRRRWGAFEEATHDALSQLRQAVYGLPPGRARDDIESYVNSAENTLGEAVEIAIQAAHSSGG